ncbi:AMP-binding protein [Streptomyces deserti]
MIIPPGPLPDTPPLLCSSPSPLDSTVPAPAVESGSVPRTVPFARNLAAFGDRTALITEEGTLSYRHLAARVSETADRLGRGRRLVLLAGANRVEALVVYLAALSVGHPLLLVPGDNDATLRALTAAYEPDVVAVPRNGANGAATWVLDERHRTSAHTLHPDLALLLSTSGSTGSPKLVRLSHDNLQSNAESIAAYLGIEDSDRAATTLPMHYCYGLSVINSHLLRGAGLILTGRSVADAGFWELFRTARGTALAGVPYTFDLLDRVGFDRMRLPHLRRVTQAGGRLAPERVVRYAELGRRAGWELFVMYGQTEATARMAYLPPHLAAERPQAVGVPIPGGSFRLRPLDGPDGTGDPDTGELVYSGPNVMLGYAESPTDLGLGRTVEDLYTGDIARRAPDGLYEIVGRRSRFAKILGLRIDPQRVEAMLERHGVHAFCAGDDDALSVVVARTNAGDADLEAARVRRLVAGECGLPPRAVRVRVVAELPRLATGKPDHEAVRRLTRPAEKPAARKDGTTTEDLCRLYAEILDRADVTEDSSFVGLGGDSLSYVEMSLRLEQALGTLPADWHTTPIGKLRPSAPQPVVRPVRRLRTLETGIALRAVGIVLVVGSHIPVFPVQGGAHVLLGVAGFNFARFHLTAAERRRRVRGLGRSILRVAVPSMLWLAFALALTGEYDLANVVLANSLFAQDNSDPEWRYWFVEALVYFLVAMTALLAVPLLDRAERRSPFGFALGLVGLGLVGRYDPAGLAHVRFHLSPTVVFFLFAMGWAAARARTVPQRLLLTAVLPATVPGLFAGGQPLRTSIVVGGLALLIWVPVLPSLDPVNRVAGLLAGSSLYIYLTHFHVYPYVRDHSPLLALLVSLLFGVAYGSVSTRVMRRVPGWLAQGRPRRLSSPPRPVPQQGH